MLRRAVPVQLAGAGDDGIGSGSLVVMLGRNTVERGDADLVFERQIERKAWVSMAGPWKAAACSRRPAPPCRRAG